MSQPDNKKPGTSRSDAATTDKNTRSKPPETPPGKDPNEYDPVGMAGKPAGILLELGEEASEEAQDEREGDGTKNKARRTVPGSVDEQD